MRTSHENRPSRRATVELRLHRQQAKALTCPATELLYGGAAGGGKSHLMRVAAIRYCLAIPGLQAYIFRRGFADLQLNHMQGPSSFPELLAPLVNEGKVQIVQDQIRFLETGSTIHLCNLQYTKSLAKYQGAEIHLLLMDELTHFTEHQYRYLRARVRIGGLKVPEPYQGQIPRIICGSNPGGVGHHWVKETFVDEGPMRPRRTPKKEGGMVRIYIPAKVEDNPSLLANDPEYLDRLEGLGDPNLVRAMREGDWDVVAGAMYGGVWRKSTHIVQAFPIPIDWPIWRGADDGYAAPASVHWLTQDPNRKTYYVIAELYRAGMLPAEYADRVLRQDGEILRTDGHRIARQGDIGGLPAITGYLDAAAFANNGQNETPRGPQIVKAGAKFIAVPKWPGSRVARVQNLHKLLAPNPLDPAKRPGLLVFENQCPNLVRTLPALPRDEKNQEDVDTDAEDHAFDSLTYGLQWKKPQAGRVRVGGV
jgi:hypothetical protein